MQYTTYGKTNLKVSRFGLGCMRYPNDEAQAIEMVRYALDNGVNYLDTAYAYGESEVITGRALKHGYRNKAYLATKSPIWYITKHADFEKYLDEELLRLGTDYIDIYLLHNLDIGNWERVKKYDGFTFLDNMVKKGKIKHRAFSYHGTLNGFKEIVDFYDWEMAQIQLNILDEFNQAGVEGLKYAASKEMAVVIMEPLRGGHILNNCPEEVLNLISNHPKKLSLLEWAFKWLYNMPETTVIISGTSSLEQLKENIKIFDDAKPNTMTSEDLELIRRIQTAFNKNQSINCTGCKYCIPCPNNVEIPEIFKLYNSLKLMDTHFIDKVLYKSTFIPSKTGADQCIECGLCEKHCPQSIKIIENLKKAHELLIK